KQQEAAPPPRQARPETRRNLSPPKRNPPKRTPPPAPTANLELLITELEQHLEEIEQQLQAASEIQDLSEIARLGEEHIQVAGELEARWAEWSD
ncbi:MAG: hypothetical protein ACE5Q6_24305, partial [Dehalococcoidia bacterium]